MPKIAYLNPSGAIGGAERVLLNVIASCQLAEPSIESHLVVSAHGPLVAAATHLGVAVKVLKMPPELAQFGDSSLKDRSRLHAYLDMAGRGIAAGGAVRRYLQELDAIIREIQPDIIHSNGNKFHLLTGCLNLRPIPVLWHIHDFLATRPLMRTALHWASRRISGAVAVSRAVADDARTVLHHTPIEVIYNGIDTELFSPGSGNGHRLDELANMPPADERTVRIGLVATYARWKGQDVFLRAVSELMKTGIDRPVRFYIVGGPIYETRGSQFTEAELRSLAGRLGIEQNVGFISFQEETPGIYRNLDIVVHASTQPEPFGLTIVEAMACGKPVIISQAGGAAELFADGEDGLGVSPGNAVELATAIKELTVNAARRERLSRNARVAAVARFGTGRLGMEMTIVYRGYLPRERASGQQLERAIA